MMNFFRQILSLHVGVFSKVLILSLFVLPILSISATSLTSLASQDLQNHTFSTGSEIQLSNGQAFRVLGLLGEGISGKVYKAVEVATSQQKQPSDKPVALKIIVNDVTENYLETLNERYQLIRDIQQDNHDLVGIQDWTQLNMYSQTVPNSFVLIAEFIEGMTLDRALDRISFKIKISETEQTKRLDLIEEFIGFAIRVLHMFSSHGIIYGDMSPKNVMITPHGQFKIIDLDSFYTEHLNRFLVFTSGYSPREITKGFSKSILGATDLFNVSLMTAEFLIGQHPAKLFIEKRKKEILAKLKQDPFYSESQPSPEILFWERISYPEVLQEKIFFHEMQKTLAEQFNKISGQIENPTLRAKYIELANFVFQTLEFEPQNRGFYWKGVGYTHQLKVINCNEALDGNK